MAIMALILAACANSSKNPPRAIKGEIDFTETNFSGDCWLLSGDWRFAVSGRENIQENISVPGDWRELNGGKWAKVTSGIYYLNIKVPPHSNDLGLRVDGISTSYELEVNGQKLGGVGLLKTADRPSIPQYDQKVYRISSRDSLIQIKLQVSNECHYRSGIVQSVIIGDYEEMIEAYKQESVIGGVLLGIFLVSTFIYILIFVFLPRERYFFHYALFSLFVFVHYACLSDRMLYDLLGESGWTWAYRIELATIFIALIFKLLFYSSFFSGIISVKLVYAVIGITLAEVLLLGVLPAPLFTWMDKLIPFNFALYLALFIFIFIRATRKNRDGAILVSIVNIFIVAIFVKENFIYKKIVQGIQPTHYFVLLYSVGITIVIINRIIKTFKNEHSLSSQIIKINAKLEYQNRNLEEIVINRTSKLVEVEKRNHQLELEKKERDLDLLATNNLVKLKYTQNLIEELENLPKSEKELKPALNALISRLKGQAAVEGRLEALQKDLERVNAEFYERLNAKFPDLSKTERELCAYIKLNLSNKDIAELRKTSLNTINVTRSRLRKKLGLTRDEELESFVQQF